MQTMEQGAPGSNDGDNESDGDSDWGNHGGGESIVHGKGVLQRSYHVASTTPDAVEDVCTSYVWAALAPGKLL